MKISGQPSYERPQIQTMHASRIIELLGPVSCGSGSQELSTFSANEILSGGDQNLAGR